MEHVRLTFAELYCLLRSGDEAVAARAARSLRLPGPEDLDELVAAGISSLATRSLATVSTDAVAFLPELRAIVNTLSGKRTSWLQLAIVGGGATVAIQILSGEQRLLVQPVLPGVYEFTALDNTVPLADAVEAIFDIWSGTCKHGAFAVSWAGDGGVSAVVDGGNWTTTPRSAGDPPDTAARAAHGIRLYLEQNVAV